MQYTHFYPIDLATDRPQPFDIGYPVFNGDHHSVRLGVDVTKGGTAQTITGTVQGIVLLPNGAALPAFEGGKEANRAWIDLPQEAFVLPGRIQIALRVIDGTEKTVLLAVSATVRMTGSTIDYDPDDEVPTWADIESKLSQMDQKIAQVDTAISENLHPVSYDTENPQSLTDAEKAQARTNINAAEKTVEDALKRVAWSGTELAFRSGHDIVTNVSAGTVVDVENPVQSANMSYLISPCYKGDVFVVSCTGLNAPRAWAWTDAEYTLISKAANGVTLTDAELTAPADGYLILNGNINRPRSAVRHTYAEGIGETVASLAATQATQRDELAGQHLSEIYIAQRSVAQDWHLPFIDVFNALGLGQGHKIPGTATIWAAGGTTDLTQRKVWMSDGTHPFKGTGVTAMYARTIANQMALISPSYYDTEGESTPSYWAGRRILWMGTSIPAGSDPEAGEGTGATYPALVASQLGATVINRAKGSSCLRINASAGDYRGFVFTQFARAVTRTTAEIDALAANWDSVKDKISLAPDVLSESYVTIMKQHSFENLILPYLDGTNAAPDVWVIDYGRNDIRPRGVDNKFDLWVEPTVENINSGVLAADTYMTADSYANLKTALGNDLSGITNLAAFAASLNRNCYKGAMNFIITLILRYNPRARIVIVSDYDTKEA